MRRIDLIIGVILTLFVFRAGGGGGFVGGLGGGGGGVEGGEGVYYNV